MKSKLLMLTFILMLCMAFALSVGAQVTTYDDAPERTKIQVSVDDVIVFDDGFTCPAGYVFKDQTRIENNNSFASACDFEYIDEKTGKNYTFDNVVALDIPQGVTYIGLYAGQSSKALKRVSFPDSVTSLGNAIFQHNKVIEECIFEHGEDSELSVFPAYMFHNSSVKYFSMPDCIREFSGGYHFSACSELSAVYLSKNLEKLHCTAQTGASFDQCKKMYLVNESFTGENVPEKPKVYYFPSTLSYISKECVFRGCDSLNEILVFGEATTSVPSEWTFQTASKGAVVFLGDMTNVDTRYWGERDIFFANEADLSDSDIETLKGTQKRIYCHAQNNTVHLAEKTVDVPAKCESDAGTVTFCFCGYEISKIAIENTALTHDLDYINGNKASLVSIVYSDYSLDGTKTVCCGNCGENKEITAPALLVCLGYSVSKEGQDGLVIGFKSNREAISEYASFKGVEIRYGLFVVSQEMLKDNEIFGKDGQAAQGVINAEMTRNINYIFQLKVRGFNDSQKDKLLALGAYIITTDSEGNSEYTYHQPGTRAENEKYSFVTYNGILG